MGKPTVPFSSILSYLFSRPESRECKNKIYTHTRATNTDFVIDSTHKLNVLVFSFKTDIAKDKNERHNKCS